MAPFTKSRKGFRRATTVAGTKRRVGAPLSLRQKKQVKKLMLSSKEKNHHDVNIAGSTVLTSTALITDLTSIAQGDGDGERIGDRLTPRSYRADITVADTGASRADADSILVRVMLVRWNLDSANENLTFATQLLETSNSASLFLGEDTERRKFDVLYDRSMLIHGNTASSSYARHFKIYRPLKGRRVIYNEGLTTGTNKLYLVMLTSDATNNKILCTVNSRLTYVE